MGCKNSIPVTFEDEFKNNWRLLEKLGEGSFSHVYAVNHRKSGRSAALKIPNSRGRDNENTNKEAEIWRKVGFHAHIVYLIDDFVFDGSTAILMERCDSTLAQHMMAMKGGRELSVSRILHQMASAIAHIHSFSIVHRDIKTDNFLCNGEGSDPIVKLCDFGFAKTMPPSGELFGIYGTPFFMSPEMVRSGPHNLKTDVWSLGVIFYRMIYGDFPYAPFPRSAKVVLQAIDIGTPGPSYDNECVISSEAKAAVIALLQREMSARPSAAQALELPFFHSKFEKSSVEASLKSSEAVVDILSESQSTSCDTWVGDDCDMTLSTSVSSKFTSKPRVMSL